MQMDRCGKLILHSLSWRSLGSAVPSSLGMLSAHHRPQPQAASSLGVVCLASAAFEFVMLHLKQGISTVTLLTCRPGPSLRGHPGHWLPGLFLLV